jgi:hypothetical protein
VKKGFEKLPVWLQAVIALSLIFIGATLFGDSYRRNTIRLVELWIAMPVLTYIIFKWQWLEPYLTDQGMKIAKFTGIIFFLLLSFMIFDDTHLRHRFAHHYFSGKVWIADEGDSDDNGNPIGTTEYDAPTQWGRFVIGAYPVAIIVYSLGGAFSMPMAWIGAQRRRGKGTPAG